MSELTEADRRALAILERRLRTDDAVTASELGDLVYGDHGRDKGGRMQQSYARPGGKIARSLVASGYLYETVIRPGDPYEQRAYALTGKATTETAS